MRQYDPLSAPNAQEWRAMDEGERIALAEDYHRRAGVRLPNAKLHAVTHVIVENQLALAEAVPVRTLKRLVQEGLDRHEAVHAIAMVVMEFAHDVLNERPATKPVGVQDPTQLIYAALEKVTAESWRRSTDESE